MKGLDINDFDNKDYVVVDFDFKGNIDKALDTDMANLGIRKTTRLLTRQEMLDCINIKTDLRRRDREAAATATERMCREMKKKGMDAHIRGYVIDFTDNGAVIRAKVMVG